MMRRRLSHPPRRGQSRVTAAKQSPIAKNSSKYVKGANQTKCRPTWYRRPVGLIHRHKMRAPTSSNPAARPHQAARMSTSRGTIRRAATDGAGPGEVAFRFAKVALLIPSFLTVSSHRFNGIDSSSLLSAQHARRPAHEVRASASFRLARE